MPLSPEDRERLAKLMAMFSSTYDGEILNAAKAAERLVKNRGETWEAVLVQASRSTRHEQPKPKYKPARTDFQDEIDACMEKVKYLTPWEQSFLTSISERWTLSEKQRAILDRIKEKLSHYEDLDF